MGMRKRTKNFVISGGILTTDFILNLQEEELKQPLIKPNTFSIPPNLVIKNQNQLDNLIKEAWERLLEKWDEISIRIRSMNVLDSRQHWTIPFLKSLGFIDIQYSRKDISFEDDKIQVFISHRGWARADAPKIHIVEPNQELDKRLDIDRNKKSPHDSLQLYLNLDKSHMKWGVVTNGLQIRLLRDFFHTHTRGYVEFDVESILYERNFTDFRTLYRLIHTSRFIKDEENKTVLDKFYEKSVAAGSKIGEGLRENVKKAIELIGNGLLTHELREAMIKNEINVKEFFQEILRVIYRILFLMFAEQRGMLPMHNSLYVGEYSITKLRERTETRIVSENHFDLWYGLFATFSLIREGSEELGVFEYNGDLFDDSNLEIILGLKCRNDFLLRAIRYLTLYEKGKILQRINFIDLGVEEIGAIYESLLDFTPRILDKDEEINKIVYRKGEFILDPRGLGRKTTGSYYTDSKLINTIIDSTLKPMIDTIITKENFSKERKESALLELKICDPACGSGAFLIAANNFLGKNLAIIRAEMDYPSESIERNARRDVLIGCIYGVDLNPMAVELTKVSLWINSSVKDLPLNFLDHHIKCGNSLLGTTSKQIKKGIPDEAFTKILDDNNEIIQSLKRINKEQGLHKFTIDEFYAKIEKDVKIEEFQKINKLIENSKEQVLQKRKNYSYLKSKSNYQNMLLSYNAWVSVFLWDYTNKTRTFITNAIIRIIENGFYDKLDDEILNQLSYYSEEYKIFNWCIEFSDIFFGKNLGFDCIISNPPWEKINIKEREFFQVYKPEIANAANAAIRKKLIMNLKQTEPELWKKFRITQKQTGKFIHFLKKSGLYPLSSKGLVNLFAVFTELALSLVNKNGRVGLVIPSNLITDYNYKEFFNSLISSNQLISVYDFVNRNRIFQDLHRSYKFSLVTIRKRLNQKKDSSSIRTKFLFNLTTIDELEEKKQIEIMPSDIEILNPNTKTCPIFTNSYDYQLTLKIYRNNEVILNMTKPIIDDLHVHRMFNMSDDSRFFITKKDLKIQNYENSKIIYNNDIFYPIYESKLIWLFDHRYASFEKSSQDELRKGYPKKLDIKNRESENFAVPRYWIKEDLFKRKKNYWSWDYKWFLAVRDITNATNRRTAILAIIPDYPTVNSINLILGISPLEALFIVSMGSTFVFDYCARQKIGGVHLNQFILEQLPIIKISKLYEYRDIIVPKAIELIYTSNELKDFAKDCGYEGEPFIWNLDKRYELECELNAIYAILYGVSKIELEYILDSFSIIKDEDIVNYDHYKTKEDILILYDKYKNIIMKGDLE